MLLFKDRHSVSFAHMEMESPFLPKAESGILVTLNTRHFLFLLDNVV